MNTISVLLVDDSLTFLHIATRFLQKHDDIVIAGAFSSGEKALEQVQDLRPDVVLIDLSMPDLPGLEAIPRLRVALPEAGIIALTLLDTNGYREAVQAAGADDFVSKTTMGTDLLPAIWRTMQTCRRRELDHRELWRDMRGIHGRGERASSTRVGLCPTMRCVRWMR